MPSPAPDSPAPASRAADLPPVLVVDDEYGPREAIAFSLSAEFARRPRAAVAWRST